MQLLGGGIGEPRRIPLRPQAVQLLLIGNDLLQSGQFALSLSQRLLLLSDLSLQRRFFGLIVLGGRVQSGQLALQCLNSTLERADGALQLAFLCSQRAGIHIGVVPQLALQLGNAVQQLNAAGQIVPGGIECAVNDRALLPRHGGEQLAVAAVAGQSQGGQLIAELDQAVLEGGLLLLQLPAARVELGHAGIILPDAVVILVPAVVQLLSGVLQLGHAVLIFLKAVLVFPLALVVVLQTVQIFLPALLIVNPAVIQLFSGILELVFAVQQLLPRIGKLLFPVGDLLLRVGDFLVKGVFAVPVLRPAVVQFLPCVTELRLGIGQLLGHLCLGVGELLLGLVDLLLGLVPDRVPPQLGPLFGERLQLVGALLYQLLVGVAVSH